MYDDGVIDFDAAIDPANEIAPWVSQSNTLAGVEAGRGDLGTGFMLTNPADGSVAVPDTGAGENLGSQFLLTDQFDPSSNWINQELMGQVEQARQAQANGDTATAGKIFESLSKSLGSDKVAAALIQGGFGMLAGFSQGKMLEKKWQRDKEMRNEEWARKDTHSKPGAVGMLNWAPNAPKSLLGAAKVQ